MNNLDNLDNLTTMMVTADDIDQFNLALQLFKISKIKKTKFKKALVKKALELRKCSKEYSKSTAVRQYNQKLIENLQNFFGYQFSVLYEDESENSLISGYAKRLHFYTKGIRFQIYKFEKWDKENEEITVKMKKKKLPF